MQQYELETVLAQLRGALETDDVPGAAAIIAALHPSDQADVFSELQDEVQIALLPELHPGDSADILEKMDDEQAAELVAALSTDDVIRIVDEMEPDEAADLLGDIDPEQARAVLEGLEDAEEVRPLLLHPDDSAGGLMTSEFLALRATGIGALLPLIAARLHIDPTVVSGPVMSTLVDATGLFIYFSIARAIMGL